MIDTTKLRELAQKATPGPWTAISDPMHFHSITTICAGKVDGTKPIPAQMMVQIGGNDECAQLEANTRFIAAANPAVALALLDEIDRLRADKAHVTTKFESTSKLLSNAIDLVEKKNSQLVRLRKIEAAARNLAKVKGRHNSEIAMNKLMEALK